MSGLLAITRQVSPAINQCELTLLERQVIDLPRAQAQHREYEQALGSLGIQVLSLPAEPDLPDSVFVEDAAVVLDECALLTRPGADSRKPEVESIAKALSPYRKLFSIQAPGSVDGGDVLTVGKSIFVGLSSRTNQAALEQMQTLLAPFGYEVRGVEVTGCLHLKSAATEVSPRTLLVNPGWVEERDFPGMAFIEIDPSEPYAANALRAGEGIIYPSAYPRTRKRLEDWGLTLLPVDASELAKAEGALTCCSLIFKRS